jgi:hypothetical protein
MKTGMVGLFGVRADEHFLLEPLMKMIIEVNMYTEGQLCWPAALELLARFPFKKPIDHSHDSVLGISAMDLRVLRLRITRCTYFICTSYVHISRCDIFISVFKCGR